MPFRTPPARTKGTTTQTGSLTTFTVAEPVVAGWRTFTKAVTDGDLANGDTVPLIIVDTTVTTGVNLFQLCTATWNNTTKQFTVVQNKQPAVPPSWGAGTRDVVIVDDPVLYLLLIGGTLTGVLSILISGGLITPAAETCMVVERAGTSGTDVGVSFISGDAGQVKVNAGDTSNEKMGGWRYDNSTNIQTFRTNGADRQIIDASGILKTVLGGNSYDAFAGGAATVWPFYQATAPTGWTKSTTHNDKALRVVSGTGGGSGGSTAFSAATVGSTTLTVEQLPAHTHLLNVGLLSQSGSTVNIPAAGGGGINRSGDVLSSGSTEAHTHTLALQYLDLIICSKN